MLALAAVGIAIVVDRRLAARHPLPGRRRSASPRCCGWCCRPATPACSPYGNRFFDALLLGGVGAAIFFLATTIPNQPRLSGQPVRDRSLVLGELTAWSAHRTGRVALRTATKNQLLGQLDRTFPGLTLALPDVLATKVGRLVAAEFSDPARLAALGSTRFIRFGATRGLRIRQPVADRLVHAARDALPTADAAVARAVLAADLALLVDLDAQIDRATDQLARLLPQSPFTPLLTVPGWGPVRAGNYGGALGDPARFDNRGC